LTQLPLRRTPIEILSEEVDRLERAQRRDGRDVGKLKANPALGVLCFLRLPNIVLPDFTRQVRLHLQVLLDSDRVPLLHRRESLEHRAPEWCEAHGIAQTGGAVPVFGIHPREDGLEELYRICDRHGSSSDASGFANMRVAVRSSHDLPTKFADPLSTLT